ncbi:MAG: ABC transporter ATP-binding protein [Verrucomicrobia bacterium]|nr:ABC transporter ATP-binding protein [Verrucomicrobiota bacterium]MDA1005451.1 ABC transporter ATP-binding protein [Verrucomicrobiota bacterium]
MLSRYKPYLRFLRPAAMPFAIGIVAGIVYGLASGLGLPAMSKTIFPILFKDQESLAGVSPWFRGVVATLFGDDESKLLLASCLAIPLIFVFRAAGQYLNLYFIQKAGLIALEGVRVEVFAKLQHLPMSYYQRHKSGDLLSRVVNDASVLRACLVAGSADLVTQPVTLLGALSFLIYLATTSKAFLVVLAALASIPLCIIPIRLAGKKLVKRARREQALVGEFTEYLAESLQSPQEIRSFNMQEERCEGFKARVQEVFRTRLSVVKYQSLISPSIEVIAAFGFAVGLFLGVSNGLTLTEFLAVAVALFIAYDPIKKLGRLSGVLKQGGAAIERLEEVLNEVDLLSDPEEPMRPEKIRGTVTFRDVNFAYAESPVLKDISVEIAEGETIGLVGSSGAGKSTFVNLIPRLYEADSGSVEVSGQDVRQWRKHDLRDLIAFVPQQPTLFATSIIRNIRVGRPDASDEEVREAARMAYADDFIQQMPDGYETLAGERGSQLSGGQRQRIAIARAFLKQAPILILDEAASALDSESEDKIQAALESLVQNRTTFIIAHRFSTLSLVDRIIVMDAGRIVGLGTHATLLDSCPIYRNLYDRQVL